MWSATTQNLLAEPTQYKKTYGEVVRTTDQQRLSRHPLGERFLKNKIILIASLEPVDVIA